MNNFRFLPPVGELCVQTTVSETGLDLLYWYRDHEDDPNHMVSICVVSEFSARPSDTKYVLTTTTRAEISGTIQAPVTVHNHICSWQELCAIKQLWQQPVPGKHHVRFIDWALGLIDDPATPTPVVDRLRKMI